MEPLRSRDTAVLRAVRAGFTLVEMLVVLAIMAVIMAVVVTSQGAFNRTLLLSNTAYDIALFIRSAESYGITTHVVGKAANAGYGVDFTASPNNQFTLFHDVIPSTPSASLCHGLSQVGGTDAPDAKPGNCLFDKDQGEQVTQYQIQNGVTIESLCTSPQTGGSALPGFSNAWTCGQTSLDITFARPNPEPNIYANGASSGNVILSKACIVLKAPQSGPTDRRYVSIVASGGIAVLSTPCQ